MSPTKKTPVHPAAALFPMMSDPELADLAADIAENGLIHPIVLGTWEDGEGGKIEGVIDGRNRLRACEIAEVEPKFAKLNGADPLAYIVSSNIERRSLTASQKAIATALIWPDPEKGGRGKKTVKTLNGSERVMLSNARAIVNWSRTTALEVLGGGTPFDTALNDAKEAERERRIKDAHMAELRNGAPDLAESVERGEITVSTAVAALEKRKAAVKEAAAKERSDSVRAISGTLTNLLWWHDETIAKATKLMSDPGFVAELKLYVRAAADDHARLVDAAELFLAFAEKELAK